MSWLVTAPSLKGHVLSAAFKDGEDLSKVRLELSLALSQQPEITQGVADTRSAANLGGVHDILASERRKKTRHCCRAFSLNRYVSFSSSGSASHSRCDRRTFQSRLPCA